ncbi:S-layer homology domain-containing protein [Paenibacillus cellulositrophicus]|uniref:S-layer homology domain-containing protein n=1 Tax=Paenibacillus cellulositrophicus TaxID=562959 RepID=UPI003F7D6B71
MPRKQSTRYAAWAVAICVGLIGSGTPANAAVSEVRTAGSSPVVTASSAAAATTAAAEAPYLSLEVTSNGSKVTVTVTGEQLKDLYAYELTLSFDPAKLAYRTASTGTSGFSVEPIVKNNEIRLAHTKVGKTAGDNGKLQLAVIEFTALQTASSRVAVESAKLVDSALRSSEMSVKPEITVRPGKAEGTPGTFRDIRGHWAEQPILNAVQQGWVSGYPDGTFQPGKEVTRAEFASMMMRAVSMGQAAGSQALTFSDAKKIPAWALSSVQDAVSHGIMNGYADGTFGPSRLITRAEMAAMTVRALGTGTPGGAGSLNFADRGQIPAWAKPYIASAVEKGIMHGRAGSLFAPNAHATRAEAVAVILSVLEQR